MPALRLCLALFTVLAALTPLPAATQELALFQGMPFTDWVLPGSQPVNGVAAWVYVAPTPAPAPRQLPTTDLRYTFRFGDFAGLAGQIELAGDDEGHLVRFVATDFGAAVTITDVRYPWVPGRPYLLLFHKIDVTTWGGWIYDQVANAWTFLDDVGPVSTPEPYLPTANTTVSGGTGIRTPTGGIEPVEDCADFPRVDVSFSPPLAIRGSEATVGSAVRTGSGVGDCLAEASWQSGWLRYRLGSGHVTQGVPVTAWSLGTGEPPVNAVGTWVYVAPPPPRSAGQLPATGYVYGMEFEYGGQSGVIGLSSDAQGGVAGVRTFGGGRSTAVIRYPWQPGHAYFLFVTSGEGRLHGWVYDQAADAWTAIGEVETPGATPLSAVTTGVFAAQGAPVAPFAFDEIVGAANCAAFPRVDAYISPPLGFAGSEVVTGTVLDSHDRPGACRATVSTDFGWTHFQLGTAPTG